MKFKNFFEIKAFNFNVPNHLKQSANDVKDGFNNIFNKKQKEINKKEIEEKRQNKKEDKEKKKNINDFIKNTKKDIKTRQDIIENIKEINKIYNISNDNLDNIKKILSYIVDGNSYIISANLEALKLHGPIYNILDKYNDINISKNIANIEKAKLLNKQENSIYFNYIKNIIYEIIKQDILKNKGVDDGNK